MASCPDCGCKVYGGHCVNCHEETYIYWQNCSNDEPISLSSEFMNKVNAQEIKAKKIKRKEREAERIKQVQEVNNDDL